MHADRWVRAAVMLAVLVGTAATNRTVQARIVPAPTGCGSAVSPSSGSSARLVAADNAFGFRLLAALRDGNAYGNAFISPTSISLALGMAYDGARGSTAIAMNQALGLDGMTQGATRLQAASLLNHLSAKGAGLTIANSLWARRGVGFQSAFLRDAQRNYGATTRRLDVTSPHAPATINRWVSCATRGKIPSIINRIPPAMILYLINAVYFHGDWASPFKLSNTHRRVFTTAAGSSVQVPMMSQTASLPYWHSPSFQMVRLPYRTQRFSMVVLEPRAGAFQSVGGRLTADNWRRWTAHLRPTMGALSLPRFSLSDSFVLNDTLRSLGMAEAFSTHADFSGMCRQPCRLSDVRHKTYLAVNERGTVATAATSVGVQPVGIPAASFHMTVDHPFYLAIQDIETGAVLFAGAVTSP